MSSVLDRARETTQLCKINRTQLTKTIIQLQQQTRALCLYVMWSLQWVWFIFCYCSMLTIQFTYLYNFQISFSPICISSECHLQWIFFVLLFLALNLFSFWELFVAGYIPNCSLAVEAMLATASLGAIWSSTSPDFGVSVSCVFKLTSLPVF